MHAELDPTRRSRLAAVLIGAALLTFGGAAATARADTPPPQLSIAVDNGSTSAKEGDPLTYTITLTNLGTSKIKHLRVSQTVPAGASVVSVGSDGDQGKSTISWSVDLAAAQKITLHTTMGLGTTPESALRLATVACAQVSTKGPPLVCASDSDLLPAGAAAAQLQQPETAGSNAWLDGRTPWYAGGGAVLVLALGGALLLVRRHRHRRVAPVALRASTPDVR